MATMQAREITFVSSNSNKIREVQAILGDEWTIKSKKLELEEIQGSIHDIAVDKCLKAAKMVGTPSNCLC